MPIEIKCSACGKTYLLKDEFAGKTAKCMQCGGRIQIPSRVPESPAHAELAPSPLPVAPPQISPIAPPPLAATPAPMPNHPPQVGFKPQTAFLLKPRSFIETVARLAASSGSMLGVIFYVLCLLAVRNGDLKTSLPIPQIGVYCIGGGLAIGVIIGLVGASFLMGVVRVLRVTDREAFLSCLEIAISQMRNYAPGTKTAQFLTFHRRPRWVSESCEGPISVQVEVDRATIVGPKTAIAKLLDLLNRLNNGTYEL